MNKVVKIEDSKWQKIQQAANDLDGMVSEVVLKACDVGDMLREVRLTMDAKSFTLSVMRNLNQRNESWANKMMVLSFRRKHVMDILSKGEGSDSIRSTYESVKFLEASKEEEDERGNWPRAKPGPKKGSENAGRPKKDKVGTSYVQHATDMKLLTQNAGGIGKKKFREKILEIDPTVEFPGKGRLTGENEQRYRSACDALAFKQGKPPAAVESPAITPKAEPAMSKEDAVKTLSKLLDIIPESLIQAAEDVQNPNFMVARTIISLSEKTAKSLERLSTPQRKESLLCVMEVLELNQRVFMAMAKDQIADYNKDLQSSLKKELSAQKKITADLRKSVGAGFSKKDFRVIRGVLHSDREIDQKKRDEAFNLFLKLSPIFE